MIDLAHLKQTIRDIKVMVVGDVMLDRYVYGDVSRISPEAPVPVLKRTQEKNVLGGAANVAANVRSLGARPILIGKTGKDESREELIELCVAGEIDASGIIALDRHKTITKARIVSGGQQIVRVDNETSTELDDDENIALLDCVKSHLVDSDVIILSDYAKGVFSTTLAQSIISLAISNEIPVIVDPKGEDFQKYEGAFALTPNRRELEIATNAPVQTDRDVSAAAGGLIKQLSLEHLLATRSEEGMSVVSRNDAFHLPARAREVFDVSGAGDTVIASFALGISAGLNVNDAARFANAAAAVAVSKRGTAQVDFNEVQTELNRTDTFDGHLGVVTQEQLMASANEWRRRGLSIGFTNGCFDILHFGHVSILERARAECDRLIVGLNSDASVGRLKGTGRPLNNERDRSAVLSALRSVDAVVLFGEDTPLKLIEKVQPDLLFKGADYELKSVVGRGIVEKRGGRVVLLDLEEGRSTTNIVDQILTTNSAN